MRPRSRDKKLSEEWAGPLNDVEDINEVRLLLTAHYIKGSVVESSVLMNF